MYSTRILSGSIVFLILVAACLPATPAPVGDASALPRLLATVYISPTPPEGVAQATRVALQPSLTAPPSATPVTPTPYVGIFVGEAELADDLQPIINPELFTPPPTRGVVISRTCVIPVDATFGTAWNSSTVVAATLGCPIQEMFGFNGAVQIFERGAIYRRGDSREMWAIAPGGIAAGEYWYVAQPPALPETSIEAPPGYLVPRGDFFALWLGIFGIRDTLGFATTREQDIGVHLQRFDGGTLFKDVVAGQVFALFNDGSAYGPY